MRNLRSWRMLFTVSCVTLILISSHVSPIRGSLQTNFVINWKDGVGSDLLSAIDQPSLVIQSNNELECALGCLLQFICTFFNYIEAGNRCELYKYRPSNYSTLPGYRPYQNVKSLNCPDPGIITKVPAQCCALPFTLNGGLFYGCTRDPPTATNLGCFHPARVWVTCDDSSKGYTAANQTVNLTIPTFPQTTLVASVNNWIVMQQRIDLTSFNLSWSVFKSGFGSLNGNFWLGLEKVYQLTKSSPASLRIEMLITTGQWLSAEYSGFILDAEANKYAIHLTGFSGDIIDIMPTSSPSGQNGMKFTTFDSDNDNDPDNCAVVKGGGFWYNACYGVNLHGSPAEYVYWLYRTPYYFSITRMMLKLI